MHKFCYRLVCLFTLCSLTFLQAQELPEVIPPSPTVANLMQFEEVPVSYYTGQPNISIPLYSKAINGDLAVNIGLSYNTQGVKVNNHSGWTGTGWSLMAGGSISRTVRGLPDEWQQNTGGITGTGVFHNPTFWSFDAINDLSVKQEFLWKANGEPGTRYDYELDLFQFNFLGISGRFIIVPEGGGLAPKLLSKNQNIAISIDYHPTTYQLNSFTITDTKGYVYTFDVTESSNSGPFIGTEFFDGSSQVDGANQAYVSVNAWHLSKIEMPNNVGGNSPLVEFSYQTSEESYTTSVSTTSYSPINPPIPYWNEWKYDPYSIQSIRPREVVSYYSSTTWTKKLSTISFRDGTEIQFDLRSTSNPHPETNGQALEYIRIKKGLTENKHFKFIYDTIDVDRLWLNQIDEVANGQTNSYNLVYTDKGALASFNTPASTDDWGYNMVMDASHCNLPIPDTTAIYKGLLNKIIYPTGGVKEFEFERHKITYQGNTQLTDDEYRDKNPDNWIPTDISASYDGTNNSWGVTYPDPNAPSFVINQTQQLTYYRDPSELSGNQNDIENTFVELRGANNFSYTFDLSTTEHATFTLDPGTYEIHFITPNAGTPNVDAEICFGYKNFEPIVQRYIYGGGVRIKSIKFRDNVLSQDYEKNIEFSYDDANGQNRSSGSIDGLLSGLRRNYNETITRFLVPAANSCGGLSQFTLEFNVDQNIANVELTQGQYVGYKTIKVSEPNNGYSIYTYTSAQDHYSDPVVFEYPFPPADDIDYMRGLLTSSIIYDDSNRKLKETINTYGSEESILAPTYKLIQDDCKWRSFYDFYSTYVSEVPDNPALMCGSQCSLDCIGDYNNCGLTEQTYLYEFKSNDVKSSWAYLTQTQTKDYFYDQSNNQTVKELLQEFVYDDTNYQLRNQKTIFEENGVLVEYKTTHLFPHDPTVSSNTSAIKTKLINLNKVNEVLETKVYKNDHLLSQTNTVYEDFDASSEDLVLPKYVETIKDVNSAAQRIEFVNYDIWGNPLEVKKTGGTHISYVWGYNGSYPLVKVVNATQSYLESLSGFGTNYNLTNGLTGIQKTSLRGLTDAQVSMYDYDPLIGIIGTEDTREDIITYNYDAFNRLVSVKDKDGFMLSKNEYVYGISNYIKTTTFQVETLDGEHLPNTTTDLTDDQKIESITYADGLGRATQSIVKQGGGNKQDIIIPMEYDDYGRQPLQYLPYADPYQTLGTANLNKRNHSMLLSDLEAYYVNKYPEDQITATTINAFSETSFEASPLNRVLEQGAPGKDWVVDTGSDTDHTIKFEYLTNNLNTGFSSNPLNDDNVKLFKTVYLSSNLESPDLYYDGYYQAGELYKTVTKDENWQSGKANTTEEFKDSQGRVVLKRTFNGSKKIDTYYSYDDYGNLSYVLSPKGSEIVLTQNTLTDFAQVIPASAFSDTTPSPFTGDVTVSLSGYTLTVTFNLTTNPNSELKNGPIVQLDEILPNMFIGDFTDNRGEYTISIHDGYFELSGSGKINDYSGSFTVTVPQYSVSQTVLDDLCYQYHYDKRNRLIEKKVPGKGWEYIVYDNLDRPVLTQDANLRANNQWLFTKYDDFNRVVYTGVWDSSSDRATIQASLDTKTVFNESRSTTSSNIDSTVSLYYTNNVFPDTNISELHTINYYDDYSSNIIGSYSDPGSVFNQSTTSDTKGLSVVGKVRVLDTDHWITTVSYYDDKAQPIYIATDNDYLDTEDILKTELDFLGKPIKTESTHTKNSGTSIVILDEFTYDHAGRLLTQKQTIGSEPQELIVSNTYDELGQLIQKGVGDSETTPLQNVDYTYNIRGWLQQINDYDNLTNDLFGFKLSYNNREISSEGTDLFNGNISQSTWRTKNDVDNNVEARAYSYEYDMLNRILEGTFGVKTNGVYNFSGQGYSLRGILYDSNGNLKALQRSGDPNNPDGMDNLTYQYNGNQLTKVKDGITSISQGGFIDGNKKSEDYDYDANGNMIEDLNKGIEKIEYNLFNLPVFVSFLNKSNISYVYDASGVKQKKIVDNNGAITTTTYAGNFIYEDTSNGQGDVLKFFSHPEGYTEPDGSNSYSYIYQYKDHLGNVRLTYADSDGNGSIDASTEIISEKNYYPFGLSHRGYNNVVSANANSQAEKYQYNGKELNEELGLDWYDYGARNYDPAIGRWMNIDNMADLAPSLTPFRYAFNNPIKFLDPDGNYERDGHFWTVYLAATITRNNHRYEPYGLAYFAEAPDHVMNRRGDVRYATNTWLPGLGYQNPYHALGGTNRAEEAARSGQMYRDAKTLRARGAALHRLGDSYAHSRGDGSMYPLGYGHWPNHMETDKIAERPDVYLSYVKDLIGVLGGGSDTDLFAFEYIANSGGSTEQNSAILEAEVRIREGVSTFSVKGDQTSALQSFFGARNKQYGTNNSYKTISAEVETMEQNKDGEWVLTGKKETRTFVIGQQ